MVASAVLGAATGTGLALLVAMTVVIYRHYILRKRSKEWGDLERYDRPLLKHGNAHSFCLEPPPPQKLDKYSPIGEKIYKNTGSNSGSSKILVDKGRQPRNSTGTETGTGTGKGRLSRCDKISHEKSCPNFYTQNLPQQEFLVGHKKHPVQPYFNRIIGQNHFYSIQSSNPDLILGKKLANPGQNHLEVDMLTHQSRSLPVVPPIPGARLARTPSVSSQSHIQTAVKKGHRGSSPAIRTFTPEGLSLGSSPPESPNTFFARSLSPNPLRAHSFDGRKNASPNSSNSDLRANNPHGVTPAAATNHHSHTSLSSLFDRPLMPGYHGFRRASTSAAHRCVSPLLIPPKSPTPSDNSSSPGPISPLLGSLQVELYQKKDLNIFLPKNNQPLSAPEDRSNPLGKLHFRLKYDLDKSDLHVHVIEAHDLTSSDHGGFNDPYVRVTLLPNVDARRRQTNIHRNEPNPFFDENFKFPVSQDQLKDRIVVFQVFDYDRYSRNDVVGEVTMRLDEFNVTTNLEVWGEIYKNKKPSGEKQEILISLSFLPSAERLTVVILKARNLYIRSHKESLDPFVKVYLIGEGKRLKKKKTSYRKGTNDPVWNEAVSFSVSSASINSCALELCVLDQSNDLMGSHSLIGSCIIGPRETGAELNHWHDMKNNFRKSVAKWHILM